MTRIISIVGGLQPSTPTIGTATAGDATASVAFTPSTYIGKGTITYTATSNPGGLTNTGSSSPIIVSGLTNGTAYTFTVTGNTNYGVASVASNASNSVTPSVAATGSYDILAAYTVPSGGVSSITFAGFPTNGQYAHLQLRMSLKADATTNGTPVLVYNSDTSSVYTYHHIKGDGSSAIAYTPGANYGGTWYINGGQSADQFGAYITDIFDYAATSKAKTIKTLAGFDNNGSGSIFLVSQAYINTATPITSFTLTVQSGNISQFSNISLYGVKG
jgi:hypothetical protein